MCSMGCVYLASIRCEWIFGQGVYRSGPRRGKIASSSWATSSIVDICNLDKRTAINVPASRFPPSLIQVRHSR